MAGLLARIGICLAACAVFALSAADVRAQGHPDRPAHILVGFAPGGSAGIVARGLTRHLAALLEARHIQQQ